MSDASVPSPSDAALAAAAYADTSSYSALFTAWRALSVFRISDPTTCARHTWTGQVFSRRELHKSLLFLSFCTDGSAGTHARVEVLVRRDVVGVERMRELVHTLRAGDVWRVTGALENPGDSLGRPLIVATHLDRIAAWPDGADAYDRFAVVRAPPLLGVPPDYATSIAGPEAEAADDVSAAPSKAPVPTSALREECFFKKIPLHRLCRWYVASGCTEPCKSAGCAQLHTLSGFGEDPVPSAVLVAAEWGRWRARVRALGLPTYAEDDGAVVNIAHRAGHSQRARAFCDWLQRAAPHLLSSGVVLDVAGGRGDVARILARAGAEVVTVDPRPPKINRRRDRNTASGSSVLTQPRHILTKFDGDFEREHADLLARVSLIIGFHPDEATEPIAAYAMREKVPIAIVPCCVFGRLFPHRRLADGSEVESHDQFVTYLREISAGAGKPLALSFLEYNGANRVLWNFDRAEERGARRDA